MLFDPDPRNDKLLVLAERNVGGNVICWSSKRGGVVEEDRSAVGVWFHNSRGEVELELIRAGTVEDALLKETTPVFMFIAAALVGLTCLRVVEAEGMEEGFVAEVLKMGKTEAPAAVGSCDR